jgi:uncharacterized protein YjbI with pentapeptide repeats
MRSACVGEPIYGEHEGKRYCVLHIPFAGKTSAFNAALTKKLQGRNLNFQGVWFPEPPPVSRINFVEDVNFSGAFFSRGADFSYTTFSKKAVFKGCTFAGAGAGFANAKFKDEADFSSATFTLGASFKGATFHNNADFSHANFGIGAIFEAAHFVGKVTFTKTLFPTNAFFIQSVFDDEVFFTEVVFGGEADFGWATFKGDAYFFLTRFQAKADFTSVKFESDAEFNKTDFFGSALFRDATFQGYVGFWGYEEHTIFRDQSFANFQYATIEHSDRVSFHTLALRPHWFANVDSRKFDFTNVDWNWVRIPQEVESLRLADVSAPHRLLAIACRHLAVNSEENHRYEEASKFRYMAMEARRLESWRGFAPWRLSWWYWLASGYGERVGQAFFVLLGILLLSALLYNHVGFARWESKVASEGDVVVAKRDDVGAPLKFSRALTYSAGVMTFQKPEPRPATTAAQTVVLLETILGPVQAALLALAIRRKFMR